MDTTLLRRDKREDQTCGCAVRATCTYTCTHTNNSPNFTSPAIARRTTVVLCRAALCCTVLCCDVAASAFCIAGLSIFQRGRASWPPILFLTSHSIFSCYSRPFVFSLPGSLCLPVCLSPRRSSAKVRVLLRADELIQQWQAVGEKACQSGPAVPQLPPSSWPCLMRP